MELEEKLQSKLYQSRVADLRDLAELSAIRSISVRVEELRVVEDIEELRAEINAPGFGERDGLQYRKVGITDVRPATDRTRSSTEAPKQRGIITSEYFLVSAVRRRVRMAGVVGSGGILREAVGIEKIVAVRLRFQGPERSNLVRFAGQFEIKAVHQLIVRQ